MIHTISLIIPSGIILIEKLQMEEKKISVHLKEWIATEITTQLKELKAAITNEFIDHLNTMKRDLHEDVLRDSILRIQPEIDRKIRVHISNTIDPTLQKMDNDIKENLNLRNNQIVLASNNMLGSQISAINQNTKELIMEAGRQITNTVYSQIISEINEKIVPKVNNMVEYVSYQMQDGGETVLDYRKEVEKQVNKNLQPDIKAITDGREHKQIISEHVRVFYGDDSDSEED